MKAGPWFLFLRLMGADDHLIDHRVHRPKPTKSAGKINKAPAAPAVAAADADAAEEWQGR